jgi:signal transduction histidine kinase/CheY-like chemotaxis protein
MQSQASEEYRKQIPGAAILHDMFEAMPHAVAAVSHDLRIIALNGRMRSYLAELGLAVEIEGRSLAEAFSFLEPALETISLEMVEHCAPEHREKSFTDARGEKVEVRMVAVPPSRGDLRLLLIFPRQGVLCADSRLERLDEGVSKEPEASSCDSQDEEADTQREELRVRASRLESLELLAGGIAHDFNNLLTLILGSISLVRALNEGAGKAEQILSNAEKAVLRAEELTRQLSSFARGGKPEIRPTDLKLLIEESVNFSLLGSRIKCESNLPDDLWTVNADRGQIGQVIGNLVINAWQAMADGGRLKVSACNKRIAEQEEPPLKEGRYVKTELADSGHGIPAEILEKIFDPYFTTKASGTGLGLATVFSIVRRHGGLVKVDSRQGEGSVFSFFLPATVAEKLRPEVRPEKQDGSLRGRILVMDDEEDVSSICSAMLERVGHEVVICDEGAAAVEVYMDALRQGVRFDLVILDLTVPGGLGGLDALDLLREIDPDVRAIVSSGYCSDPVMADPASYGFMGVVPKPYDFKMIKTAVAEVLQRDCRP